MEKCELERSEFLIRIYKRRRSKDLRKHEVESDVDDWLHTWNEKNGLYGILDFTHINEKFSIG